MQDKKLNSAEQTQSMTVPVLDHSRLGGGPTISGIDKELTDIELQRVAGGPIIVNQEMRTITDLADDDLRQVAGGPSIYNE